MLQEAFDLGWSGIDWRTARVALSFASKLRERTAAAGSGAAAKSPAAGDAPTLPPIGEEGLFSPVGAPAQPSTPPPPALFSDGFGLATEAPAPPPASDPPRADSEEEEDDPEDAEDEARRLEWIQYYVRVGKLQEAFDSEPRRSARPQRPKARGVCTLPARVPHRTPATSGTPTAAHSWGACARRRSRVGWPT